MSLWQNKFSQTALPFDTQAVTAIFSLLPTGVVIFDSQTQVLWANEKACNLGITQGNLHTQMLSGTSQVLDLASHLVPSDHPQNSTDLDAEFLGKKVQLTISKIPAQSGQLHVLLIDDISHLRRLEQDLAQSERLAILGKLCAKVAHELNNPMDGVLRYLNLTIRTLEHSGLEKPLEYLQQCRRGLLRMVQITSELLEFSRSNATTDRSELRSLLDEAARLYEAKAAAAQVQIIKDYRNMPAMHCDGNFYQVFCNIIKNALDVMPEGGSLNISTAKSTAVSAAIEFTDTGPGCKPGHESMIFEPFFTTKPDGKGTGLGLAVCKDIVEKYGGTINAQNTTQGGCAFTINLPI